MRLPSPLQSGVLLRRYKRFLADIKLDNGDEITAHTPNTGSMMQCAVPGHRVLVSLSDNPTRKYRYTLELIEVNRHWVDTNTQRANRIVEEGLQTGEISDLQGYRVQPEYRFGESRIDFFLEKDESQVLIEVKNVTLCCESTIACFPDAVTARGQKHLRELKAAVEQGYRSIILFLVQRAEAKCFSPADLIDPEYGRLLRDAVACGVEPLAIQTTVTAESVTLARELPVVLP
jgi:sugar fermentation stimulation protein A